MILSIVDQNIADPYRKIAPGLYDVKNPLLAQIARDLRTFCAYIKDANVKIGSADGHKKGGRDGNDE